MVTNTGPQLLNKITVMTIRLCAVVGILACSEYCSSSSSLAGTQSVPARLNQAR